MLTMIKKTPRLISICGYKQSGKDTIAKYVEQKYNYKHIKISNPLKRCLKDLFNLSEEQIETKLKEEIDNRYGTTPRKLMQFFGTEIMQNQIQQVIPMVSKNFWINKLIEDYKLRDLKENNSKYIISDLRFLHEYDILSGLGLPIEFWRVGKKCSYQGVDLHISENEFKYIPVDHIIYNNKDIDSLLLKIDEIINA